MLLVGRQEGEEEEKWEGEEAGEGEGEKTRETETENHRCKDHHRLILGRRRGIGIVGRREVAIGKDSGRETETEKERRVESLIGQQPVSK
jgi:hypothetical protein